MTVDPEMPLLEEDTAECTGMPHGSRPNRPSPRPSDTVWEVRWRQRIERDRSRSLPYSFTNDDHTSRGISVLEVCQESEESAFSWEEDWENSYVNDLFLIVDS